MRNKRCAGCSKTLPPSSFKGNARSRDGLNKKCRDCALKAAGAMATQMTTADKLFLLGVKS